MTTINFCLLSVCCDCICIMPPIILTFFIMLRSISRLGSSTFPISTIPFLYINSPCKTQYPCKIMFLIYTITFFSSCQVNLPRTIHLLTLYHLLLLSADTWYMQSRKTAWNLWEYCKHWITWRLLFYFYFLSFELCLWLLKQNMAENTDGIELLRWKLWEQQLSEKNFALSLMQERSTK